MPTLAELRRQVWHKLMAMARLEGPAQVPEEVLRGHCVLLATMAMDPSGVLTRASSTDPRFVFHCDHIMAYLAQDFAEELGLIEQACVRLQAEAHARRLRGAALEAWCATRLHTEFIGRPRRRRVTSAKRSG